MGYGDYVPYGSHQKKPLTKKQLQKIQEAYIHADSVVSSVKSLEGKEQTEKTKELDILMRNML